MNTGDSNGSRLETKAITTAAIEEVERQAAQNPSKLRVTRTGTKLMVNGGSIWARW